MDVSAPQGKAWGGVFVGHATDNPFETEADKKRLLLERFQAEVMRRCALGRDRCALARDKRCSRPVIKKPKL